MGSCQSETVIQVKDNKKQRDLDAKPSDLITPCQDPSFPDMPEWKGNRYSGIGIKRMKGYKCTLPIDELMQKRSHFWTTKINYQHIWQNIQQACVYDEYRSNLILEKLHMRVVNNCINHIVDQYENHYYIPNYCINDPYFEKELNNENDEEKIINIIIFDVGGNTEVKMTISNLTVGSDLKEMFRKKSKINKDDYKIRLFFSGTEILDDHLLFQHNLDNDYKIQLMKIPLPKVAQNTKQNNNNNQGIKKQKYSKNE